MKIITLIMATMILSLAFKPGVEGYALLAESFVGCCATSCAPFEDHKDSENSPEKEGECDGKSCNPFQVCCSSVMLCQIFEYATLDRPHINKNKIFNYKSLFTAQFATTLWQPPEIVF